MVRVFGLYAIKEVNRVIEPAIYRLPIAPIIFASIFPIPPMPPICDIISRRSS